MKKIINEDLNSFSCSFVFTNDKNDYCFDSISQAFERYNKLITLEVNLSADEIHIITLTSLEEIQEYLNDFDNETQINLTLKYSKDTSSFYIFEPSTFINNEKFEEKLSLWETVFNSFKDLHFLDDLGNEKTIPLKEKKQNNISSLNKFNEIDAKPKDYSELSSIVDSNKVLSEEFKIISSFTFLKNICSAYDFIGNESFTFEGYSNFTIPIIKKSDLLECNNNFMLINTWLLQDKHLIAKLGILRNILSLSKSRVLNECFNNDLINALYSNFQIYLKENINQYFDVKNKVSEFIFELSNKSSNLLEDYISRAKNILLAVISYFFTVVVLTVIDKNNTVKTMFSIELGMLSSVFVIAAIYLVYESRKELIQKSYDIVELMIEIKGRYNLTLSQKELDEMFKSPTLNRSMERIKKSNFHRGITIILCIILVVIVTGIITNIK